MKLEERIISCKGKIYENNEIIKKLSIENDRLFKSLLSMLTMVTMVTGDKKERYDRELASDNWKIYSKIHKLNKS